MSIGSDSAGNTIQQRWNESFVSVAKVTKSLTADSCIDIAFDDDRWNLLLEVDSMGTLTYNGEYTYFGVRNLSGSIYPDNSILFEYWTKCGFICSNGYTFTGHKQN